MKLAVICPEIPSSDGGAFDHARLLSRALSQEGTVVLWSGGLKVAGAFERTVAQIKREKIEGIVLAYTPFLFGGWNTFPTSLVAYGRAAKIPVLVFVHEILMPSYGSLCAWFKYRLFHHWQDRRILKDASAVAVTFQYRCRAMEARGIKTMRIPAFSNVPLVHATAEVEHDYLLALFGTGHKDMQIEVVESALALRAKEKGVVIGGRLSAVGCYLDKTGPLSAEAVGGILYRAKFFVVADVRGIALRKGSAAAAFQHGRPILATRTEWTDPELVHGENVFFYDGSPEGLLQAVSILEQDEALRQRIGEGGRQLYQKLMAPERAAEAVWRFFRGEKVVA